VARRRLGEQLEEGKTDAVKLLASQGCAWHTFSHGRRVSPPTLGAALLMTGHHPPSLVSMTSRDAVT